MLAEWFQITAIVSIAATFLAIVGGVIVVVRFLLDLNTKITKMDAKLSDFKDEMRKELTELKIENVKMQSQMAQFEKQLLQLEKRFDKYDGVNTELEKRVAEIQKQQQTFEVQIAKNEARIAELQAQSTASENRINAKLQQVETENRDFIKELVQTVSH